MSQYGAYGYARHGADYSRILAHYYTGTNLSKVPTGQTIRVLLQTGARTATFTGATDAPGHNLDEAKTYQVRLAGRPARICSARTASRSTTTPAPWT